MLRQRELSGVSSPKGTNLIIKALSSWLHLTLMTLQSPPPPNTFTVRVKASIYKFWGDTDIQSVTSTQHPLYVSNYTSPRNTGEKTHVIGRVSLVETQPESVVLVRATLSSQEPSQLPLSRRWVIIFFFSGQPCERSCIRLLFGSP